jgi:hypothetical protein
VHSGLIRAVLPDGSRAFAVLELKTEAKKVKNNKIKNIFILNAAFILKSYYC